jgi:hypothetical protein
VALRLFQGADFVKTRTQRVGKGCLHFRSDDPGAIEVLEVDLIADKNQVYGGTSARLIRIHQHVDSASVPVAEACLFRCGTDSGQVGSSHGCVDIPGRAGLVRLTIIHVKERRYSTNNSVREAGGIHGRVKTPHSLEQLFHVQIEGARGQHGHLDCSAGYSCLGNPNSLLRWDTKGVPTILMVGPYRMYFYSHEPNEPPHIHIDRDEQSAKFWLDPVALAGNLGFSPAELRRVHRLVEENRKLLLEKWHERFPT